jgi:hypothetical protein
MWTPIQTTDAPAIPNLWCLVLLAASLSLNGLLLGVTAVDHTLPANSPALVVMPSARQADRITGRQSDLSRMPSADAVASTGATVFPAGTSPHRRVFLVSITREGNDRRAARAQRAGQSVAPHAPATTHVGASPQPRRDIDPQRYLAQITAMRRRQGLPLLRDVSHRQRLIVAATPVAP